MTNEVMTCNKYGNKSGKSRAKVGRESRTSAEKESENIDMHITVSC